MGMRRRLRSALLVLGLSLTLPAAGGGPAVAVRAATPNRLIDSGSPYLLQHAHNPVEWYPWGPEAIEKARREGKPIFLSIGYSTCYWCHVANRTLYSDPEIAALMNRWFINIKVDREQRPDLDALDMLATTLMTGRSGWPNNLFLTPDLKPIFAGGYFPPEDDPFGRPGFPRILRTIRDDWTNRRAVTEQIAERAAQQMREAQRLQSAAAQPVDVAAWLGAVRVNVRAEFDARHGGFTQAGRDGAKFPRQPLLAADFRASQDREALDMLAATLDGMALGGIHDHLGGGFHRYSIEPSWSVPHFEKMLYDNAQLLRLYAEAWQLTKKPLYREVAQRTGAYLLRRLAAPAGGFYTAEDAEVAGKEGASYVWSAPEIEAALGASGAREFFAAYQLTRLAAQREQDALEGVTRGVLRLRAPLPTGPSSSALSAQRAKLLMLREARPQPRRDEKMIVALNGLAIDAFAVAGRILGRDDYVKTAERAARRVWARGEGFLDDYAHFANGLLSLAEAHGAPLWRERAARLADDALRHFARADGSLAMTLAEQELLVAPDESGDTAYPSGTSAAVQLLLRLALEPGGARHQRAAERALAALAGRVQRQPDQWPTLVAAAATMRPGALARHGGAAAAALAPLDSAGKIEAHVSLRRLASHDEVVGRLRIAPGFHVNANPASYKHLVPTAVRLEALEPERVRYPPPRLFKPSFERQELMVYEGEVELVAELKPGAIARPGALRGEVRVQACDDTTCLPPGTVPIALEVR